MATFLDFCEVFKVEKATVLVQQVEPATSRKGQAFWRVHTADGSTLYTYDSGVAAQIQPNQEYEFDLNQSGRYWHIVGLLPVIRRESPATQEGPDGYPTSFDQPTPTPVKTSVPPVPENPIGTTNPPQRTFSPNTFQSGRKSDRNPLASFAISYAKDIEAAYIKAGHEFNQERFITISEMIYQWMKHKE